ncbi:chemotaxis protein CheB [Chitinophaga pinensis]|uniref:protein-glutamate methylesterase n=1 Tax=Chitinophaga pinensis (strain ATCC 43595 / DSM 2588 / LMG 13176 / NBRC 15968 / NCIMB 11800 / UQM 2034) TaxID=485918 RepID=A0A979GR63_CHIPD|nr:chemotaxis protein CheB [Chitinophaga pinensis]ACU62092.1 CheB methylesterase [Chitinophaga pinensis DSM 2588]
MNFLVVAVAVSGGGIEDLKVLFSGIPADCDMAFIVVAPVQRDRESKLADIVARYSALPVIKATETVAIYPGNVYVIAENSLMLVEDGCLHVRKREKYELINTAIKDLFYSMAMTLKNRTIAVVLGGMGDSATFGATMIGDMGGYVVTKEPDFHSNSEMTKNVIEYDTPNAILPLEEISNHLMWLSSQRV